MHRLVKENTDRLKGKGDKETKTLLFTGKYQKLQVLAKCLLRGS
jgi:hypothetical protein